MCLKLQMCVLLHVEVFARTYKGDVCTLLGCMYVCVGMSASMFVFDFVNACV